MTSPQLFTAHDVPDLVAVLPTRFGFVPEESVCVIATTGPRHRFGLSMRMDLPAEEHHGVIAATVVHHLRRQGADGAIVVAVSERPELAGRAVWTVERALGGVRPVVSAWATSERYWTTFDDCPAEGHPYVPQPAHLAVVQAVAEGMEILPSRAEMARRFDPVRGPRRRWLDSVVDAVATDILSTINRRGPGRSVLDVGREELGPILQRALEGRTPNDDEMLRLAVWVSDIEVRDHAWGWIDQERADAMVALWTHVARHAPSPLELGPLCLAALAAYLRGNGAQALVAAERAAALDPHYTLATLVIDCLQNAVPPEAMAHVARQLHHDQEHGLPPYLRPPLLPARPRDL